MKFEFRNALAIIVCSVVAALQVAAPFLSQPARASVNLASGALMFGLLVIVLLYNKKKFGLFLPGRPISNEEVRKSASKRWPAAGSADTELGVMMEPEVGHGETYFAALFIITFIPVFLLMLVLMSSIFVTGYIGLIVVLAISAPVALWLSRVVFDRFFRSLSQKGSAEEN